MFDFDEDEVARISLQTLPEKKQWPSTGSSYYLEKLQEHANLIDAKLPG